MNNLAKKEVSAVFHSWLLSEANHPNLYSFERRRHVSALQMGTDMAAVT